MMFGNKFSPTIIALPITSQVKVKLPTHIPIEGNIFGLPKNSVILAEQIRTLDKTRLREKVGRLSDEMLEKVKKALEISCGMRFDISFLDF